MANKERYNPEDAKYMGYSLIFHITDLTKQEVINTYFEKDTVEKAWHELKSTTSLYPIRKYRMEHVRPHVKICYLAYAILSYIQYKFEPMEVSAPSALENLQSSYKLLLEARQEKLKWNKTVTLKRE